MPISNKLITENPVKEVKQFREENYKVRYLTSDEQERLYKTLPDYLKPLVTTALQTGMRQGEIFNLKWDNIDFDYNFIEVLETKSGKSRKIPLSKTILKLFNRLSYNSEFVFVNPETNKPYVDIKNSWHTALREAGIKDFRFHDLRHTVATRMCEKGIPIPVIQSILGHSKVSTTMRYAHAIPAQKLDAISVLDSYC